MDGLAASVLPAADEEPSLDADVGIATGEISVVLVAHGRITYRPIQLPLVNEGALSHRAVFDIPMCLRNLALCSKSICFQAERARR